MSSLSTLPLLLLLLLPPTIAQPSTFQVFTPNPSLNRSTILTTLNTTPLTPSEKRTIISAARLILNQLFVHKNIARSIHKARPITQLNALSRNPPSPNHLFHAAMNHVFESLNDFHTLYRLPPPVNALAAVLPLSIRIFYTNPPERRYVVTELFTPDLFFTNPNFKTGVEVIAFDGLPIDQAVRRLGRRSYGANPAARINRAEHLLTARPIAIEPIPHSDAVVIQFKTADGAIEQVIAPWLFGQINDPGLLGLLTRQALDWPYDRDAATAHHAFLQTPMPDYPRIDFSALRIPTGDRKQIEVAPAFRPLFSAEVIATKSRMIGRLTLPSFGTRANPPLIAELSRVLKLMPSTGLVIDIRANLGGLPDYVKALTELFSDIPVPAQPIFARVSTLQQRLTQSTGGEFLEDERLFMNAFRSAIRTGFRAGEEYTGPVGNLFDIGLEIPFPTSERVYFGPVITLIDGRTYSSGDIFAALQVDQGHSLVVGVSDNTGAGGASSTRYRDFVRLYPKVFEPLPQGIDFSTALSRFHRTGKRSGTMIEAFGVKPQIRYYPTFDDVVGNECDMFEFLGEKLASMSNRGDSEIGGAEE